LIQQVQTIFFIHQLPLLIWKVIFDISMIFICKLFTNSFRVLFKH